jgi:hypothetical protein
MLATSWDCGLAIVGGLRRRVRWRFAHGGGHGFGGDVPLDIENPEAGVAYWESPQPLPVGKDAGSLKWPSPFARRGQRFERGNCLWVLSRLNLGDDLGVIERAGEIWVGFMFRDGADRVDLMPTQRWARSSLMVHALDWGHDMEELYDVP